MERSDEYEPFEDESSNESYFWEDLYCWDYDLSEEVHRNIEKFYIMFERKKRRCRSKDFKKSKNNKKQRKNKKKQRKSKKKQRKNKKKHRKNKRKQRKNKKKQRKNNKKQRRNIKKAEKKLKKAEEN